MHKFLPKTAKNPSGFTLVELLVTITIIAILSVVGVTVFSGVQKNARDATRKLDIDAIAKALEVNKIPASITYPALLDTNFAAGKIPINPKNGVSVYCINASTAATTPPAAPTAWLADKVEGCPADYKGPVSLSVPAAAATAWTVCALLENGTNPTNIYCKGSAQ